MKRTFRGDEPKPEGLDQIDREANLVADAITPYVQLDTIIANGGGLELAESLEKELAPLGAKEWPDGQELIRGFIESIRAWHFSAHPEQERRGRRGKPGKAVRHAS